MLVALGLGAPSSLDAQGAAREAADIVRSALEAYEAGRADALDARWRATLVRSPGDRSAQLGRAYLDFLNARYPAADSGFSTLLRDSLRADAIITQAWLGRSIVAGQQARFARADSLASRALVLARANQDPWATTAALTRLAQYRVRLAGVAPALALLTAADSFAVRVGNDARASVACIRAQTRNFAGDSVAYRDARRGLSLIAGRPASRLRSACLFTTGQHFFARGVLFADSSARYFRLAAAEQRRLRDWAGRAGALQWLGATLQVSGQFTAARAAYADAIAEAQRSGNRSALAWATMGLGQMQADFGNDIGAAPLLTQAAEMLQQQGDQFGYQTAALSLMFLRLRRGDVQGVAAQLPGTEATLRRLGDPLARQRTLEVALHLARVRGDRAQARDIADTLSALFTRERRTIGVNYTQLRGLTALEAGDLEAAERMYARPEGALPPRFTSYVSLARTAEVAVRRGNLALGEKLLRDAHTLLETFRNGLQEPDLRRNALRSTAADPVDPDLGVATIIHALATGGRTSAAFTFAAERRARELLDALIRASASRTGRGTGTARRARAGAIADDAAVRAVLRDGEAMLFYVTGAGREPSTLFVLTRDRLAARSVTAADSLRPLIARLRRQIAVDGTTQGLQQQLGALVVAPALPLLPAGVSRLIIVGDGPLQDLPFDALLLPDGRPVLERFEVSVLATPAVLPLLRGRDGTAAARGALAMAVEQPGRRSPVDGAVLPSLRQAAVEARTAAARYGNGRAMIGAEAREAILYRRISPLAVLHIAAHAAIDPVVESNSAIMLAAGGGHDGNLHVWEMDDLGVAAGLVVLSGCRTGVAEGVANSGGVLGFTAPLLLAGTQTVVATQWDLSDRAAAEMMDTFHRELANGRDAGAALRTAKRAQLARGRLPSHWAVFQLIGDPAYRVVAQR